MLLLDITYHRYHLDITGRKPREAWICTTRYGYSRNYRHIMNGMVKHIIMIRKRKYNEHFARDTCL